MAATLEKQQQQQHVGASDTSNVSLTVRLIMQGKVSRLSHIVVIFQVEDVCTTHTYTIVKPPLN